MGFYVTKLTNLFLQPVNTDSSVNDTTQTKDIKPKDKFSWIASILLNVTSVRLKKNDYLFKLYHWFWYFQNQILIYDVIRSKKVANFFWKNKSHYSKLYCRILNHQISSDDVAFLDLLGTSLVFVTKHWCSTIHFWHYFLFRNCLFESQFHEWLLGPEVDILTLLLLPLRNSETYPADVSTCFNAITLK